MFERSRAERELRVRGIPVPGYTEVMDIAVAAFGGIAFETSTEEHCDCVQKYTPPPQLPDHVVTALDSTLTCGCTET
jgi:hypothetical protein